jgi:mannose-6-phosphate isomerase
MALHEPIVFEPLLMERVWGGRRLETLLRKRLQHGTRVGESWEIVDRADAQSVVHDGPLVGRTLNDLWTHSRAEIFGEGLPEATCFPLLFKLLDAQDRLSVQVHPPAAVAAKLGGEPKTEMWYFIDTLLESDLYAGLKAGVTREGFERGLAEGRVADLIHRIPARAGDAIFIPSGRVHAIGAGNVLFEVQQNSDTTYRVFDWNRLGLDGKLRELHVKESIQSINFEDSEPRLAQPSGDVIVECEFFRVEKWTLDAPRPAVGDRFAVFTVVAGRVECAGREFAIGDFFLVPPSLAGAEVRPLNPTATVLRTTIPQKAGE